MTLKTKNTGEISQIHEKKNLKRKQHFKNEHRIWPQKVTTRKLENVRTQLFHLLCVFSFYLLFFQSFNTF